MDEARSKSRVLIVEDDPHISLGVELRFKAAGFDAYVATNGQDGIREAVTKQPDAILLDVRMPVLDGISTLQHLKRLPGTQKIPVIMLSASILDQEIALHEGARCFMRKPFDGSELLANVQAILREDLV